MTALRRVARIATPLRPRAWGWAEANREAVRTHWAERKARTPAIFNGRVLMAEEPVLAGDLLTAPFFEVDYAALLAWIAAGFPPEPEGGRVYNAFAMGALRGTDGGFLLGRMGDHTANAGRLYFPCGTPDPQDIRDGAVDLATSLVREIGEETGLGPADFTLEEGWTIVRHDGLLAFIRVARLGTTADAARARAAAFLAADPESELAEIVVARGPADIDPVAMPGVMPIFLRDAFAADQR